MARDIEEFLKRAAERRRQQQQGAKPPPQQQPAPPPPAPRQTKPLVISDEVHVINDPYESESIEEHVRANITVDDVTEHASHLGEGVAARDDMVNDRIQQKFDHEVGHLGHKGIRGKGGSVQDETTSVTQAAANELAESLVEMLQNPKSVAQAIMIAEILKRPEF